MAFADIEARVKELLNGVRLLAVSLSLTGACFADESPLTPVGYWKTIDDKTGRPRAIVHIVEHNGELRGRIERLLEPPKDNPTPICLKCPGNKKNKPVIGLEFLWGFKRERQGWSDGYVLDPEEGNTYRGNIELLESGRRLKLFGYVRIIVKIGRSQIWQRAQPADAR